jgi:hypothetical protein
MEGIITFRKAEVEDSYEKRFLIILQNLLDVVF